MLMQQWSKFGQPPPQICALVELGINHEQQHQELLLTDILHLFSCNPLGPAVSPPLNISHPFETPMDWVPGCDGRHEIGHDGKGFGFDCEGPRHDVLLTPHAIASRCVTNGEWQEFIADGGYGDPRHWLSDGWSWVQQHRIGTPLYWRTTGQGEAQQFGLDGWRTLDPHAPVCHISLYEADAYAHWAAAHWQGARLPTEAEWEVAAQDPLAQDPLAQDPLARDPSGGHFLDHARAVRRTHRMSRINLPASVWYCLGMDGQCLSPLPRLSTRHRSGGRYNGKFMSGQFVLKGGSCATPRGHARASYRIFSIPNNAGNLPEFGWQRMIDAMDQTMTKIDAGFRADILHWLCRMAPMQSPHDGYMTGAGLNCLKKLPACPNITPHEPKPPARSVLQSGTKPGRTGSGRG